MIQNSLPNAKALMRMGLSSSLEKVIFLGKKEHNSKRQVLYNSREHIYGRREVIGKRSTKKSV